MTEQLIEMVENGPIKPKLLCETINITIPAIKQFVASDKFVINTSQEASVKISSIGDNFKGWLLGKTEEPVNETALRCSKLSRTLTDAPFMTEFAVFGGEAKSEITLAQMFSLMEKQGKGESGVLLTSGYLNVFHIRDTNGALCTVGVSWHREGWNMYAFSSA